MEKCIAKVDDKFIDIRAMIERQKESYIDLLSNEIVLLKQETEASLKRSVAKELNLLTSEISGI